jgi:probable HAF family extracellular repeat protein
MKDLGALDVFGNPDPTQTSWGQGVNDSGQVVGISSGMNAFLWQNDVMTMLVSNKPNSLVASAAYGINNSGHIAGFAKGGAASGPFISDPAHS